MFYKIAWHILKAYFFIFFRLKINGRENVGETGGLIFCSNHSSMMDPTILSQLTKRRLCFLAKKELFGNRFVAAFLRGLGAYPVDRENADMAAFKQTLDYLENGRIVCVFAEGSRFKELDLKNAKSGVALFALKSGAEVLPIAIKTTYKLFSKITVDIGKPVDLTEYRGKKIKTELLNEITEKIMTEVGGMI